MLHTEIKVFFSIKEIPSPLLSLSLSQRVQFQAQSISPTGFSGLSSNDVLYFEASALALTSSDFPGEGNFIADGVEIM